MKSMGVIFSFCVVVFILSSSLTAGEELNLLSKTHSPEKLKGIIISAKDWHPFPTADEHGRWQKIPEKIRAAHIRRAEKHLDCEWETPRASVFLEFVRNGNRSNYEGISFGRRTKLAELVIAECIEGRGRFLDDILNGVWAICKETYWGGFRPMSALREKARACLTSRSRP